MQIHFQRHISNIIMIKILIIVVIGKKTQFYWLLKMGLHQGSGELGVWTPNLSVSEFLTIAPVAVGS